MPTVKQLLGIATAIALGIVGAGAVGISVIDNSATQAPTNRFKPPKAEFRLNEHQQLRKILLGQEHIVLPLR